MSSVELNSAVKYRVAYFSCIVCLIIGLTCAEAELAAHHRSEPSASYVIFKRRDRDFDVQDVKVTVELARTQREIFRGLMFRDHLGECRGMLFLFDREQALGFWMKNTLIPLDIIFISEQLEIVSVKTGVPPCKGNPCPVYRSEKPAKYVVEVNAGFVEKHGIARGGRVEMNIDADRMSMP